MLLEFALFERGKIKWLGFAALFAFDQRGSDAFNFEIARLRLANKITVASLSLV